MKTKKQSKQKRSKTFLSAVSSSLLLSMILLFAPAKAQLSGTYTICASGCNYSSLSASISDLVSQGVNGAVTFNVSSGTYNESFYLSNNISGVSAANTITYQGAGRGNSFVSYSGYALQLAYCSNITVSGFTLGNTNSYGVYASGTNNCSVKNCDIVASTNNYGLFDYYNNSFTFSNNHISGGYYGMYIYGGSSSSYANNVYSNNRIVNFQYYGFYNYYTTNNQYIGNVVDSSATGYGYDYSYYENGAVYKNNKFLAKLYYPILMYYPNYYSSASEVQVYNNVFANYLYYAYFYMYSSSNVLIAHNTFYSSNNYYYNALIYGGYGSGVKVISNLFVASGSNNYYGAYYYGYNGFPNSFAELDGNDYYNSNGYLVYDNYGGYSSISSYKSSLSSYSYTSSYTNTTSAMEANATSQLPTFSSVSNNDFSITANGATGVYAGIDYDIDGNPRSHTAPMAGAYEGAGCSTPSFTTCPGNINANTSVASCDAVVNYTSAASGNNASITYAFSGATSGSGSGDGSGSVFNKGVTNVTITATTGCGSATCNFTVTVTDNVAPVVQTKDVTVYLDANGAASISTSDIDNGSTDNCGTIQLSLDNTAFNCSNLGANTVTLTATDGSNNSASAPATVTVKDNIAPTVIAKNITLNLVNGSGTITPSDVDNGSSDNCAFTLSLDNSSFTCTNAGNNTVTLTATDASGNSASATATVTVNAAATASVTAGGATTFCSGNSVDLTSNSGASYSWSNDNGPVLGGSGQTLTVTSSGTYYVTVTNSYGCSATSAGTTVTVNPLPVAGASASPTTVFYGYTTAFNTSVLSGSSSISGSTYAWTSNPSGFTSSSSGPAVTPTTTTTYYLSVTSPEGCASASSASVTVNVINVHCGNNNNKVTICHNCNTICIDASAVSSHLANHTGDHLGTCGPCQVLTEEDLNGKFEVYPNPFTSTTNIELVFLKDQQVSLEVWSIDGKLVKTLFNGDVTANSQYNYTIDGSVMMPGMYIVKVVRGDNVDYRKINLIK